MKAWIAAGVAVAMAGTLAAGPLKGHPNMMMARNKVHRAILAMDRAAKANHFDLAGHAAKAEQLLKEAEQEILLAAQTSNQAQH